MATRFPGLTLATIWLVACASSPPVQFLSLQAVAPPQQSAPPVTTGLTLGVQVTRVHLPPSLDRPEIVRQESGYTLDIGDRHRWSAPLDRMVQSTLSQDLTQRLAADAVVLPGEPAPRATRRLVVSLDRFIADPSGVVHMSGSWSLAAQNPDAPPCNHAVDLSERASSTNYTDETQAMSILLGQLASQIAGSLQACAGDSDSAVRGP
jgi:hypothetical protein